MIYKKVIVFFLVVEIGTTHTVLFITKEQKWEKLITLKNHADTSYNKLVAILYTFLNQAVLQYFILGSMCKVTDFSGDQLQAKTFGYWSESEGVY